MRHTINLTAVQGGNALILAGIAFKAIDFCLGQWESSRKTLHDKIDRETRNYQIDEEIKRYEKLQSLKNHHKNDGS